MTWLSRLGYCLLFASVGVGVAGGVSSQVVSWAESPGWRWATWASLVVFAGVTVFGWWRAAPPPAAPPDAAGHRPAPVDPHPPVAPTREGTTVATRFLARVAEPIFSWLTAYPLFPLPLVFFCLVSWGGLGDGFGFPDLVWYETWWPRFWAGLSVALLFCNLLFVRHLLDDRPGSSPPRVFGERWSLFWFVRPSAAVAARAAGVRDARAATRTAEQAALVAAEQAARADPADAAAWATARAAAAARDDARIEESLAVQDAGNAEEEVIGRGKVRRLGAFLLWVWPTTLLVFAAPKLRAVARGEVEANGAMAAGLAAAVGLTLGLVWVYETWIAARWQGNWFFRTLPGFTTNDLRYRIPDSDRHLHGLAGVMTAIPAAAGAVFLIEHAVADAVWSPVWLLCLAVGLFTMVYGFVTFHFAGLQYVLFALAGLVVVVCNTRYPGKMTFPGLEAYGAAGTRGAVNPDRPEAQPDWQTDHDGCKRVDTAKLLRTFHANWAGTTGPADPPAGKKPKLVVVATTGGGIQAAVWTAVVLEGLERRLAAVPPAAADPADPQKPHPYAGRAALRDHIRLFTGASGGMQAAGLYAADFTRPRAAGEPADQLSRELARDSLWPTVQTMLVHDLPGVAWPLGFSSDRGRTLEAAWKANTLRDRGGAGRPVPPPGAFERAFSAPGNNRSPLETPLADLRAEEETCARPLLVFSPMLVEDCRRLLISNLDLRWFAETNGLSLNPKLDGIPAERLSIPAVEFWRLFPKAKGLQVGTAARMSATFPFVGPAVSLPTDPPRRVVDAGYFDNFGINLAALWLHKHKKELLEHTDGAVIVEVRAYPRRVEKLLFITPGQEREELVSWAMSELSTPAEAVINLYSRAAYFRNDQLIDFLDKEFNHDPAAPGRTNFFTTVAFECDQPAALSWTLPTDDFESIRGQFPGASPPSRPVTEERRKKLDGQLKTIGEQLDALEQWFGRGGTK